MLVTENKTDITGLSLCPGYIQITQTLKCINEKKSISSSNKNEYMVNLTLLFLAQDQQCCMALTYYKLI